MKNWPLPTKILHSPAKRAFFIQSRLPQVPQHRLVLQRREHPLAGLEVQFVQAGAEVGVEAHPAAQLLGGAAGEVAEGEVGQGDGGGQDGMACQFFSIIHSGF